MEKPIGIRAKGRIGEQSERHKRVNGPPTTLELDTILRADNDVSQCREAPALVCPALNTLKLFKPLFR